MGFELVELVERQGSRKQVEQVRFVGSKDRNAGRNLPIIQHVEIVHVSGQRSFIRNLGLLT